VGEIGGIGQAQSASRPGPDRPPFTPVKEEPMAYAVSMRSLFGGADATRKRDPPQGERKRTLTG
jgi:hypothetical protein